jgi:6-phosphogluconolactonase
VRVYVASYENGITAARQDPATGALDAVGTVAAPSASFLAWHPDRRHLYAVLETDDGTVAAFKTEVDGRLTALNSKPTGGVSPCHLVVHPAGRHVVSANYGTGSVAVHPLDEDGLLGSPADLVQHRGGGPRTGRQDGPHAHQVRVTPDGEHILAVDLGADSIFLYRLDPDSGKLVLDAAARTEPGAGPRHLVFAADNTVHVACELDSTVVSFSYRDGSLARLGTVPATVEAPRPPNYPSEITLSADGRFVYLANRGQDVVTVFAVAGASLRPVVDVPCGGEWPRHLAVVGQYLYVANQHSHQVSCFRLDPDTGVPALAGVALEVPSPACVLAGRA